MRASHRGLREGAFREDFYHRLAVFPIGVRTLYQKLKRYGLE